MAPSTANAASSLVALEEAEVDASEAIGWDADEPHSTVVEVLPAEPEESEALELGRRASASLSALARTVKFLDASLLQAVELCRRVPDAIQRLERKLAEERARFERARERIEALERELEEQRRAVGEFKKALLDEQDAFLEKVLDEHERELDELRARLAARDASA